MFYMMLNMMFTTLKYNISRGKRKEGREGMVQEAGEEEERRRGRTKIEVLVVVVKGEEKKISKT
jgi:hypothetical protein